MIDQEPRRAEQKALTAFTAAGALIRAGSLVVSPLSWFGPVVSASLGHLRCQTLGGSDNPYKGLHGSFPVCRRGCARDEFQPQTPWQQNRKHVNQYQHTITSTPAESPRRTAQSLRNEPRRQCAPIQINQTKARPVAENPGLLRKPGTRGAKIHIPER